MIRSFASRTQAICNRSENCQYNVRLVKILALNYTAASCRVVSLPADIETACETGAYPVAMKDPAGVVVHSSSSGRSTFGEL